MSEYINALKAQGKLNISIDKSKVFNWKFTKIAGPCSVEGPEIVDIAKKIKTLGANAFRAGAYKPCTFPVLKEINGWKEGLKKEGLLLLKKVKEGDKLWFIVNLRNPVVAESFAELVSCILFDWFLLRRHAHGSRHLSTLYDRHADTLDAHASPRVERFSFHEYRRYLV